MRSLETDQYYAWGRPLADSTGAVNARFDLELERALAEFPADRPPEECVEIAVAFRKRLRFILLHPLLLWTMNSSLVARIPADSDENRVYRRTNLYSNHPLIDPGTWMPFTPTIKVAGVRMGTDKLSHVVSSGWTYYASYRKALDSGLDAKEAERAAATGAPVSWAQLGQIARERTKAALAAKQPVRYDGTCRNLTPEQIAEKEAANIPAVVRFKVPDLDGAVGYDDKVLGRIEQAYREISDFVIVRSTGKPLYLLCNVVDDIRDRITHIIRGQDHKDNTNRQVLLYEALGAPVPIFAHMPLTMDLKGAKISKRSHGEIVAVQYYKNNGFLPWALVNFLVLLGWSPGDDREIFSKEELIEAFTLERINKASSIFNHRKDDPKFFTDPKAISINAHYLRTMPIAELAPIVKEELQANDLWDPDYEGDRKDWFLKTLEMIRERFHTIKDFATDGRAYFTDDFSIIEKALKKNLLKHPGLKEWLPQLAERFEALPELSKEEAERVAREFAEELDIKVGIPINAARAVITGQLKGPSMFELFELFGKDKVVTRLRNSPKYFENT